MTSFLDRASLAQEVYITLIDNTETFEEDNIGSCLAYLMGGILTQSGFDMWVLEYPLFFELLTEKFPPGHRIWEFITVRESN